MSATKILVGELKEDFKRLENKVDELTMDMASLKANRSLADLLVRWCVFPLILILGGLVGIKVIWPGL